MSPARTPLPLLLVATAAGCGGDAAESVAAVVDSAGVRIVVNATFDPPVWPTGTPTLELGSVEGDGPEQFFRVAGATWLERDGQRVLVVADMGSAEIRLFDEAGGWLETWGRRGEGPGEFGAVGPIWRLPGDSLLVWDGRLERMTILSPDGEYGRQYRRPAVYNAEPVGRFADGSMLFAGPQFEVEDAFRMMDLDVRRVRPDGATDSLPTEPYGVFGPAGPENAFMLSSPLFAPQTVAVADTGGYWVARGTDPQVRRYSPEGELRMIARWPDVDRSVPDEAVARARSESLEGLEGEVLELRRAQVADQPVEEEFATTEYAVAGHDGELWFTSPEWPPNDTTTTWRVIDTEGALVGRVTLPKFPDRFIPLHIGPDHVVGNYRDELDVEFVRVYPVDRPGG